MEVCYIECMKTLMSDELFNNIMLSSVVFIGVIVLALIVRKVMFRFLKRWSQKTETKLDDLFLEALSSPSIFWCIAIGLYFAIGTSKLPAVYVSYSFKAIHVLVIFSVALALANASGK